MSEGIQKTISKEAFDSIIAPYKDRMIIQNVGLAYGSMIYFTMEETLREREAMFELTLWGWYWHLFQGNREICNSKTITREFAETALFEIVKGNRFEGVYLEKKTCILSFSNRISIRIEQRPEEDDGDDLFYLSLHDSKGSILTLANEIPPQFKIWQRDTSIN